MIYQMNTWTLLLICLPAFFFWITLKIMRIRLYVYLRKKFPDEQYPGFRSAYIFEIFKPRKIDDKHYISLIRLNRRLFIITSALIIMTIYTLIRLR